MWFDSSVLLSYMFMKENIIKEVNCGRKGAFAYYKIFRTGS